MTAARSAAENRQQFFDGDNKEQKPFLPIKPLGQKPRPVANWKSVSKQLGEGSVYQEFKDNRCEQ